MKFKKQKMKMAIVATVPSMIRIYLTNHIKILSKHYEITVFTNLNKNKKLLDNLPKKVRKCHVPFRRNISLFYDIKTLIILVIKFKKEGFNISYSISPKGGFLSSISSFIVGTPVRIHTFTGQVWKTKRGVLKIILIKIDKLISYCSTALIIDSKSQKKFLLKKNIIDKEKSVVLGHGSISGVDLKKFKPSNKSRNEIRKKYSISRNEVIFLYLGRINRDKGLVELVKAFENLKSNKKIVLWVVGNDEENIKKMIVNKKNIRFFPFTNRPEKFMQAADVFCLPSKREGFGTSVIEAGACSTTSIGSNIYGITDSIVNGKTGLLHKLNNVRDIRDKMNKLANNQKLRKHMGNEARKRAMNRFDQNQASLNLLNYIKQLY